MEPGLIEAIKAGGYIGAATVFAAALIAVMRQISADRKADREAQIPAFTQIQSMYEKGQQFLEIQSKANEVTMGRLQRALDREESDSATLRKELLETGRRLASIEAKNEEQARNLEANMSLVTSLQMKVNEYESRIRELESLNEEQIRRIEELESQGIQDRRLIETLQANVRDRTKEIETLKLQLSEVEADRARVLKEREERDLNIQHLTEEVAALRAQIDKPSEGGTVVDVKVA